MLKVMLREVGGRISGHGEKCGEWATFAMIFEQAVEVEVMVFVYNYICLYLSQVSNLHKIDCDHVFAGVVNEDGVGCRTCDPGFTFVKHEGRKSSTIESLKQI